MKDWTEGNGPDALQESGFPLNLNLELKLAEGLHQLAALPLIPFPLGVLSKDSLVSISIPIPISIYNEEMPLSSMRALSGWLRRYRWMPSTPWSSSSRI